MRGYTFPLRFEKEKILKIYSGRRTSGKSGHFGHL
jgi:hypothetical protein